MEEIQKIRVVIVDDEPKAREILKRFIARDCPELEVVGEGFDISSGYETISSLAPDLVFLDIHLDTQNSFDLISKIDAPDFDIIFTSGHSEYGVPAFKVNAIDYLLKPVDCDDLIAAVQKVLIKRKSLPEKKKVALMIPVHRNDAVDYIDALHLCSLEADNNYTQLVTLDGKKYIVSKTLGDMEEFLKESGHFIRIHRSIVINTKQVISYSKTEPFSITMSNEAIFEISRRKKGEVLAILKGTND